MEKEGGRERDKGREQKKRSTEVTYNCRKENVPTDDFYLKVFTRHFPETGTPQVSNDVFRLSFSS